MPDRVDVDTLVRTVLTAREKVDWKRSLDHLGPKFRTDLELIAQVHAEIARRQAAGDVKAAATLQRWTTEVFHDAQGPNIGPLIEQLIAAKSDREIDDLLAANRGVLGPAAVRSALREIPHLLAPTSPYPPELACALVGRILHVNLRLSTFLGDDRLYADCLTARSRLFFMQDRPDLAIADLRRAIALYQQDGDPFETGRCLAIIGGYQREQGQTHEALKHLLEATEWFLRQENTSLLGKTYQELGIIYQQLGQPREARDMLAKGARMRIENRQWQ